MSHEPFEFRPSGSIEFEKVEPEAVARAMKEPPADLPDADHFSINFGRARNSKPTQAERMLAGATIDWLVAFPNDLRPKALCERFPHVANRLASDWQHRERSMQQLQVLAADTRWGSTGFPAQVLGELQRLQQHLDATVGAS